VTLNDLERRNGPFALFHRIHVQCRLKTIIIRPASVSKSTYDSLWPH